MVVVGRDGRVGAVPFRLGSHGEDEKPAQNPADGGDEQEQPGPKRLRRFRPQGWLPARVLGMVARNDIEGVVDHDLAGRVKDDRPQTRDDAHDQRQTEQPRLRAEPPAAQLPELGEPAQWVGRGEMRRRLILHSRIFSSSRQSAHPDHPASHFTPYRGPGWFHGPGLRSGIQAACGRQCRWAIRKAVPLGEKARGEKAEALVGSSGSPRS